MEVSAGGSCCVLLEDEGSGTWSSRMDLCGGLKEVAGRCWSSSLSLDGRGLVLFLGLCGWVACLAVVAEWSGSEGRLSVMESVRLEVMRPLLLILLCWVGVGWFVYPSRRRVEGGW